MPTSCGPLLSSLLKSLPSNPVYPIYASTWRWFFISMITFPLAYYRQQTNPIKWPRNRRPDPLPDLGASHLPNIRRFKVLQDLFPLVAVMVTRNYDMFFRLYGSCILLRFIFFNSTILPPPDKDFPQLRMSLGVIPNFDFDLIFSGHTMTVLVAAATFAVDPTPDATQWMIFCILLALLCSFSLIAMREHYTIDVLVAWLATYACYKYHEPEYRE